MFFVVSFIMKAVIQRVKSAKVSESKTGKVVGEIGQGLFILLGVGKEDNPIQAKKLAEKIVKLRIMPDVEGKMNLSIAESSKAVLVVSQFTLFADIAQGNRPSFLGAMAGDGAKTLYEEFINHLRNLGISVETGSFGNYMEINAVLDGPVTIII